MSYAENTAGLSGNALAEVQANELHSINVEILELRMRIAKVRADLTTFEGLDRADVHLADAEAHVRASRIALM